MHRNGAVCRISAYSHGILTERLRPLPVETEIEGGSRMLRAAAVQISMELWGAIICLIFSSLIFFVEGKASRQGRLLLAILMQIFFLLSNDYT